MEKIKKHCFICGKELVGKQEKYCSRDCYIQDMHRAMEAGWAKKEKAPCPICGGVVPPGRQRYCSMACAKVGMTTTYGLYPKSEEKTRPYTEDTANIIRRWHNEGMSIKEIGDILNRSEENVMLAFEEEEA